MLVHESSDETYHRALKPHIPWWVYKENRLSSAVFKDSKGLSVDKKQGRDDNEVSSFLKKNHPTAEGEVIIPQALCQVHKCRVESNKLPENDFHHLILGENKVEISSGVARKLAQQCSHRKWQI
jgi:hypothetical protein